LHLPTRILYVCVYVYVCVGARECVCVCNCVCVASDRALHTGSKGEQPWQTIHVKHFIQTGNACPTSHLPTFCPWPNTSYAAGGIGSLILASCDTYYYIITHTYARRHAHTNTHKHTHIHTHHTLKYVNTHTCPAGRALPVHQM
jgi:hypothetical protein